MSRSATPISNRAPHRRALREAGAAEIVTDFSSVEEMVPHLDDIAIDLVRGRRRVDRRRLVRRRPARPQSRPSGRNPFVAVIAYTGVAEAPGIQRILGSGVDDLLVKPIRIDVLLDRIANLIAGRKPFVIMHNYIGPDRRGTTRRRKNPIVRIEVPNTVRAKVQGEAASAEVEKMIDDAATPCSTPRRWSAISIEIAYLVKRVQQRLEANKSVYEIRGDLERMVFVGKELQSASPAPRPNMPPLWRDRWSPWRNAPPRLRTRPTPRDVELLVHLAAAIRHAFVYGPECGRGGDGDHRNYCQVRRQDLISCRTTMRP